MPALIDGRSQLTLHPATACIAVWSFLPFRAAGARRPPKRSHPTPLNGNPISFPSFLCSLQFELQGPDAPERLPAEVAAALPALQEAYDAGSEDVVQVRLCVMGMACSAVWRAAWLVHKVGWQSPRRFIAAPCSHAYFTLQPGLSWMLRAPGGMRVAAAQLQHRVPCWGYVFQEPHTRLAGPPEAEPADAEQGGEDSAGEAQQGQQWVRRGRKLVILGDTCDSTAIAPLAMGCDLLSHEATFCSGGFKARGRLLIMAAAMAAAMAAVPPACWCWLWVSGAHRRCTRAVCALECAFAATLAVAQIVHTCTFSPVLMPASNWRHRHGGQSRHRAALHHADGGCLCG